MKKLTDWYKNSKRRTFNKDIKSNISKTAEIIEALEEETTYPYRELSEQAKETALNEFMNSSLFYNTSDFCIERDIEEWLIDEIYVFGEKYDKYIKMFRELDSKISVDSYGNVDILDDNYNTIEVNGNNMFAVDYEHVLDGFYKKHTDDLEIIWAYTDWFADEDEGIDKEEIYDAFDYYYSDYYTWSEDKVAQVATEHTEQFVKDLTPLFEQVVANFHKAYNEMVKAWEENIEYYQSEEFAEEELETGDYIFYADGTMA